MGSSKKRPRSSLSSSSATNMVVKGGGSSRKRARKLSLASKAIQSEAAARTQLAAFNKQRDQKSIKKKEKRKKEHARIPYSHRTQHILTIGEGNFSFSAALARHFMAQQESFDASQSAEPNEQSSSNRAPAKPLPLPLLPSDSIFTNPSIRLVATCYDSWEELTHKYTDVQRHLSTLAAARIPIYTGVDCLHLDAAKRAEQAVTDEMLNDANGGNGEKQHSTEAKLKKKRRKANDDDADTEAPSSSSSSSPISPLVFPPFLSRSIVEASDELTLSKLHGSQKRKYIENLMRQREELQQQVRADQLEQNNPTAAGSKPKSKKGKKCSKQPSESARRTAQHLATLDARVAVLNRQPRARFHRIIFNFPHTGCGLKDTDENNRVHREFLLAFLKHVVAMRLFYPATHLPGAEKAEKHANSGKTNGSNNGSNASSSKSKHVVDHHHQQQGELHITLKKGEPYTKGWGLVNLSKQVPGLHFKTSTNFHPHLYPGYEHRRTRGFDESTAWSELDLATGKEFGPNADISSGAMTYIFVRERTAEDDEEDAFETKWTARRKEEEEEERVRQQLLKECEEIYQKTAQAVRSHTLNSNGVNQAEEVSATDDDDGIDEDNKSENDEEDDAEMEDGNERNDDEDNDDDEDGNDDAENEAESGSDSGDENGDEDDDAASTSIPPPDLAQQLRAMFQSHTSASAAVKPVLQHKLQAKKSAAGNNKKRKLSHVKR